MELACLWFPTWWTKQGFKIYDLLASHKGLVIYISEKEQLQTRMIWIKASSKHSINTGPSNNLE